MKAISKRNKKLLFLTVALFGAINCSNLEAGLCSWFRKKKSATTATTKSKCDSDKIQAVWARMKAFGGIVQILEWFDQNSGPRGESVGLYKRMARSKWEKAKKEYAKLTEKNEACKKAKFA